MKIKNVIITGPTGAVGIALINECIKNGISVTAVCRKSSKRIDHLPKSQLVKVVECNLDELLTLEKVLRHDYDVFYHFGWDGTYGESRQDLYLQNSNVKYTLDAVNLAKFLNCRVFIGAGSQSEFGHIDGILHPYAPCNPDNGYGIAKLQACQMSRLLCNNLGMRHEWCRIVSLFGPFDGEYTLISSLIASLKKVKSLKQQNVIKYGTIYTQKMLKEHFYWLLQMEKMAQFIV